MIAALLKRVGVVLLLMVSLPAFALNELILYTFKDGKAVEGLTVRLDGSDEKQTRRDGSVGFNLSSGTHSIQILQNGESLHSFRFDSARSQYADVLVELSEPPRVSVETYFTTETAEQRRAAPTGEVRGQVSAGGARVPGARLQVMGTSITATADDEGRFELKLPRGVYEVEVEHPSDGRSSTERVRVVSNVVRGASLQLPGTGVSMPSSAMEEVLVLATFRPGTFEVSERDTSNIVDTLGIEDMARFGDSDVAASVVRIPSVTVQDNQFIFIRGLGGRYVTTTLNGATMPSTDPSKRTVPLDLFPSNIVSQLDIKKTFIASMPGESTGGNLVINTRTFPDERSGKISASIEATDGLSGEKVFVDPTSGAWDWAGWDAGEREEPVEVSAIAEILALGVVEDTENGTTFELPPSVERELQRLGALLIKDDLDLDKTETAWPKGSVSANYGDVYYLGETEFGVFGAVNYKNGWSQKDEGVSNTYTPSGDPLNIFKFQEYTNEVDISGLLSLGLNLGDHTFEANTVVSRVTQSKVRRTIGQEGDEFQAQYRNTIDWIERQYISQQISGSHFLNSAGTLSADWQFTASKATRLAPDRREVVFNANSSNTSPQSLLEGFDLDKLNTEQSIALEGFRLEANELLRRYDDLSDDNYDFSTDFRWEFLDTGDSFASLETGIQLIHRERDSDSVSYGFNVNQALIELSETPNVQVGDVISEDTITGDPNTGFAFFDKTLPSDSYEAELDYNSVYIAADILWNIDYQFLIGGRYEDYNQITETFSLAGDQSAVESEIDEGTFLPAFGFNWLYSEQQQLRLAVYRTVSRPDFKETSNATFYDPEFDFRVRGNPNLDISEVINYDLRWEWYFGDQESVSVALFYKDMDKPIERVVQAASGTAGNSRTFRNAEEAEVYGIEFEGRKEFPLSKDLTRSMFIAMNASLIESEVTLENEDSRKLQGQPDYTFNLIIGYDDIARGHKLTLLINQNGEAIKDVGILGNPDVIEEPRLDIGINYSYDFSDNFSVSAQVSNLLDEEIEFTQGGRTFLGYERGLEFELGLDWSF